MISVRVYIFMYKYIYILYTVQPVLSGHRRGFYGKYSAFEDRNVLNDMAVSFNAFYKNYKTAANYACKMQYLYLSYLYLSIYLSIW